MSARRMLILIAVLLLAIPASVFAALEVTCGATLGSGGTYVLTEDLLCPHEDSGVGTTITLLDGAEGDFWSLVTAMSWPTIVSPEILPGIP
jgi:hypothetical protein